MGWCWLPGLSTPYGVAWVGTDPVLLVKECFLEEATFYRDPRA